jgi:hypothetical protein
VRIQTGSLHHLHPTLDRFEANNRGPPFWISFLKHYSVFKFAPISVSADVSMEPDVYKSRSRLEEKMMGSLPSHYSISTWDTLEPHSTHLPHSSISYLPLVMST